MDNKERLWHIVRSRDASIKRTTFDAIYDGTFLVMVADTPSEELTAAVDQNIPLTTTRRT